MTEQTIPHEVAHLVARDLYGTCNRSHGPQWQRVMQVLGKVPDRCHNMNVAPAKVITRPHAYECNCSTHMITKLLHKRILAGQNRVCNKCKTKLRFVNLEKVEL